MCDDCKVDLLQEQDNELLEECLDSTENLYENSFLPPLEIPLEYYDNEEFYKGFKEFQCLAGKIVALTNVGLHPSEALNYILTLDGYKNNVDISDINKTMNVEVSKNQIINFEKQQL